MPEWLHNRAEHILAKNPSMPKSEAFAIATQQSHAVGKTPKGYGTTEGKHTAKAKYDTPSDDKKTANPGHLESPKMASQYTAFFDELGSITEAGALGPLLKHANEHSFLHGAKHELGPATGAVLGAGIASKYKIDPLAGAAAGYGLGAVPDIVKAIAARRKLASDKEAGLKETLLTEIPGTKPWLINPAAAKSIGGTSVAKRVKDVIGKNRVGTFGGGGVYDVSHQARSMGI